MKKIILILVLAFAGCDNEEVISRNNEQEVCLEIMSIGVDAIGNFINVGTNQKDPTDRKRYDVVDYRSYKVGQKICDFSNLTE